MGIKGLWTILEHFAEATSIDEWRGKRVAIDASVWISQMRSVALAGKRDKVLQTGNGMSEEELSRVLEGFLSRILKLWWYDITPVFVFDGPAPEIKQKEQARRALLREKAADDRLARVALQVLRAQLGAEHDAQLLKQAHANRKRQRENDENSSSDEEIEMTEAERLEVIERAKRQRERARQQAALLQSRRLDTGVLDATAASFFAIEGTRLTEKKKRDEVNRGNLLLANASATTSFLGSRRALLSRNVEARCAETSSATRKEEENDLFALHPRAAELSSYELTAPLLSHVTGRSSGVLKPAAMTDEVISVSSSRQSSLSPTSITVLDSSPDTTPSKHTRIGTAAVGHGFPAIVDTLEEETKLEFDIPAPLPYDAQTRPPLDLADVCTLLGMLGIDYIVSPSEADEQCAYLSHPAVAFVDGVFTEDSDVIARGASCVLRGFFGSKAEGVKQYRREVLERNGLTPDVMKALAMLLGCDYCDGIKGLGLSRSVSVVSSLWPWPPGGKCSSDPRGAASEGANNVWTVADDFLAVVQKRRPLPFVLSEDRHTLLQHYIASRWASKAVSIPEDFPCLDALLAFYKSPVRRPPLRPQRFSALGIDQQTELVRFLLLRGVSDATVAKARVFFANGPQKPLSETPPRTALTASSKAILPELPREFEELRVVMSACKTAKNDGKEKMIS